MDEEAKQRNGAASWSNFQIAFPILRTSAYILIYTRGYLLAAYSNIIDLSQLNVSSATESAKLKRANFEAIRGVMAVVANSVPCLEFQRITMGKTYTLIRTNEC